MKSAKDYLEASNASVPKRGAKDAITKHAAGEGAFIDVCDSSDLIKGAHRSPRGMIEFRADPEMKGFS